MLTVVGTIPLIDVIIRFVYQVTPSVKDKECSTRAVVQTRNLEEIIHSVTIWSKDIWW